LKIIKIHSKILKIGENDLHGYHQRINKHIHHTKKLIPLRDTIFVTDMQGSAEIRNGIILLDNTSMSSSDRGITARWAKVYSVGPEIDYIKPNEYVLIKHGQWTNSINLCIDGEDITLWRVDPLSVILASDENPIGKIIVTPGKEKD